MSTLDRFGDNRWNRCLDALAEAWNRAGPDTTLAWITALARSEVTPEGLAIVDIASAGQTIPPACTCPRFTDTGGFRIADLCCPVHGTDGTDPGDGYWDDDGKGAAREEGAA